MTFKNILQNSRLYWSTWVSWIWLYFLIAAVLYATITQFALLLGLEKAWRVRNVQQSSRWENSAITNSWDRPGYNSNDSMAGRCGADCSYVKDVIQAEKGLLNYISHQAINAMTDCFISKVQHLNKVFAAKKSLNFSMNNNVLLRQTWINSKWFYAWKYMKNCCDKYYESDGFWKIDKNAVIFRLDRFSNSVN